MSSADHVFGGRYRIIGEVGRGGMGVIYRGVDSVLDREVAIKVMSGDFGEITDDQRARFFREAKAAARLQHRNIVTVFEFAEQDGVPYIVMEFLKGRSLSARMSVEPALSLEQKLDIMTELCNGLDFAHENGVIHRDVKPANVWLLEDGAVKLVDFGVAKISSSMMTMYGDAMGSASYMSPEHIEGASVTGRSDVFSAAVMLYELIARRRPFEGDSPTATMMQIVHQPPPPIESIVPDLPKELIAAIAKGLEKNPDDRYQTAAEFGAELQLIRMALPRDEATVLQAAGPEATHGGLPLRSEPLPRQVAAKGSDTSPVGHRTINPWIAAGAAALLIGAIGFWLYSRDSGKVFVAGPITGPASGPTAGPAAGPAAGPTARAVRIESKPQGAAIFLNGVDTGQTTPADINIASAGAAIRLEKRYFEPREGTISDADIQGGRASYDLRAVEVARVQVSLSGEYAFEVYDGSTKLSDSNSSHSVSAREGQTLTLKSDQHYLNKGYPVEVRGGRARPIVAPELGTIVFTGNESCMVFIDGRPSENVGFTLGPLAAVEHQFSFVCKNGSINRPQTIRIVAGENPARPVR